MLVVADRQNTVGSGCILSGDYGDDAIQFLGPAGVDALDAGMGIRGMQDLTNQHARQAEIVRVFAGTSGLAGRVHHGDGFADNREFSHWSLVVGLEL